MDVKTKPSGKYDEALKTAFEELSNLEAKVVIHGQKIKGAQRRQTELRTAIDSLIRLLPEADKEGWGKALSRVEQSKKSIPRTKTPEYEGLLELFSSEPNREWRAEELGRQLLQMGLNPKAKTIYNALNRLATNGSLVRVRRGVYRSPEYGFGVISSDELIDDGE